MKMHIRTMTAGDAWAAPTRHELEAIFGCARTQEEGACALLISHDLYDCLMWVCVVHDAAWYHAEPSLLQKAIGPAGPPTSGPDDPDDSD